MRYRVSYAVGNFTVTANRPTNRPADRPVSLANSFAEMHAPRVLSIYSSMSRIELTRYSECQIIGLFVIYASICAAL